MRILNLSYCNRLNGDLREADFRHIESLDVSGSNISANNLSKILSVSSELRMLNLSNCRLSNDLELHEDSLPHLESLDLESSNISLNNLNKILAAAPELRILNLHYYDFGYKKLHFREGSLRHLESLKLPSCYISVDNLNQILAASPNLDEESKRDIERRIRDMYTNTTPMHHISSSTGTRFGPVNPTHDSKKNKDLKPKPLDEPFKFKGQNNTKNQGMIIEKLSQYLTQTHQHLDVIPKFQDGICDALSHYFLDLDQERWDEFLNLCLAWDGKKGIAQSLRGYFDNLYIAIETYQIHQQPKKQYIGDELQSYLNTRTACVLTNPWHVIAIKPIVQGRWQVYDPNYVTGYQEISDGALLTTLHTAIGTIVSVEVDTATHTPAIHDPNAFMEHGGLLALCNSDNVEIMLSQLPQSHVYSKAALDGLLLRGTSGTPAWVIALESHHPTIRKLAITLKEQFEAMHVDSSTRLTQSLDALTPMKKAECIVKIVQTTSEPNTALIEAIRASANKEHYNNALKTWDKTAKYQTTPLSYGYECLTQNHAKRLIELNSTHHLDTLRLYLEKQAASIHRPVYYIDKPDDLICSAPWMKKNADGTGELCKGPGGPLYDFLQTHQDDNPLILVNYEQFSADDIVRFNGLLDKDPHADGTALPKNTMIIGLMNRNKPDCYQGSDFYSRFNRAEHCPLEDEVLDALTSRRAVQVDDRQNTEENTTIINLYHAPDWEERLLGRWVLDGDTLSFNEGELVKAIAAGKPIEIQNGLWGDKAFERFWQQALSGGVRYAGVRIEIPEGISIIRPETERYVWNMDLIININNTINGIESNTLMLNPTSLGDFFGRYEIQGNKLMQQKGWIETHALLNQPCVIHVTRTLTDDAWAMLLDECKQRNVPLQLYVASGVALPVAFNHGCLKPEVMPEISFPVTDDALIISTDIDTTVSMMTKQANTIYDVIDVSECTSADLLLRLDGKLNQETLRFEFSQSERALITGLACNKNIILKGYFSPELCDALAPVLLERQKAPQNEQLILVTDNKAVAGYLSQIYAHAVSIEEKLAALAVDDQKIKDKLAPYFEKESLSQLKARCTYFRTHPDATNSDDAWLGMEHLSGHTHAETGALDRTQSEAISAAFTEARMHDVHEVLASSPYVFLTGLSGVGKSTFVETELCQHDNAALYLTENSIQAWAQDQSDKQKILFLDEANLSPRQWSEFEGLFNQPPSLLVNGVLHTLDEHHKVVFAGNPVSYGDERTLAPFFKRHGNAVLFTPLPPAVIYEKILKPVFSGTNIEIEDVTKRILEVYRFVCACSETEVLISPRELQMMALLTLTRAQNHPEQKLEDIAEHFTYALAKNLVPQTKRAEFDTQFKPKNPIPLKRNIINDARQFCITPSRQALSQQMNDFIQLRQWRRTSYDSLNIQQKSGGLGGMIIEGEPGIGKSELVIAELVTNGYKEVHDFTHLTTEENLFYRMPVSIPLSEKEALLIKAFHEGAVVMIDEINSSPMMERLLNDLLMGKNPRPIEGVVTKPGFMVIGTQNPVTMSGRRVASTALQRRLMTIELPEYSSEEIKTILLAKGIQDLEVDAMVEAYESNRAYAIQKNLSPVPNFRNLIDLAEHHLASIPQHIETTVSKPNENFADLIQEMKRKVHFVRNSQNESKDDPNDVSFRPGR